MDEKGAGASSNLEQGGDVRVRPESRLRDTETLVNTQWMDNQNDGVPIPEAQQEQHPSCKQNITSAVIQHAPQQTPHAE